MNHKNSIPMKTTTNSSKPLVSTNSETDDTYLFSASYQEATGLTPTIAHNEYEAASYEELYPYLPSAGLKTPAIDGIHAEMRKSVHPQKQNS